MMVVIPKMENFFVRGVVMNKKFRCPNCNKKMLYHFQIEIESGVYDKWICEDCSHIIVLDWRGSKIRSATREEINQHHKDEFVAGVL